ncbi:L-glutamate gamma-semialdehyde dehydrogenase [Symbiobacterium thermophilum]|uniref:L-glutamate gamma-semialdehyde dehydrogenase n=2 Tax=Symbiobacterium thermophilum TaxID=2734 RepID=Q67KS1_SYMTH|nr:L-glutamate gamma-semialdehyde dehydrogenase [Symbiobacterium thermophilum]BAD41726.1 1-pyrroline-5 carboxylate dehydrogenase [Symbiobacterium thermophilum IAM 14863]
MAVVPFQNEPLTDFSLPQNREAFRRALELVQSRFGREYPLIIGGERIMTRDRILSTNPANPKEVIGSVAKADRDLADKAMAAALAAFQDWSRVSPKARARILLKAAAIMRRRKHEFSATMVVEIGKSWVEADADTAEAIDFLEYYAREMYRLSEPQPLTRIPGEDNELYYIPLGVGLIIPPWNFPCAITVGMTASAIVAGNTVILKPSSLTPVVAALFAEVMEEAGLPPGVLNYLPGPGGSVGDYLVGHPQTRFISFTGSKEVGLRINEVAAKTAPGQRWIKRVVAEMGGKDAIVVDREADLDAAADGIVASAYGFQGQKCSACSRAIIHQDVYEEMIERIVERTKKLVQGDPRDPEVHQGPVADESAFKSILHYIEIGKQEGRLVLGGGPSPLASETGGYFIQPTIFADVDSRARIGQEEIFGPVLAIMKAKDFEDAIRIANDTEYGLTGSVYSRNRANLEYARRHFFVGNLYLNRKSTGALVGVHPFGGFNMSGTDSKTGGHDYLLLFLQAKAVSEKL